MCIRDRFISTLESPSGLFAVYQREVHFCFGGNCSGLVPRLPGYVPEAGQWSYRLGTLAADTSNIDFDGLSLTATVRSGPLPDTTLSEPGVLRLQPYLTATSVSVAELTPVLQRVAALAELNQLKFEVLPVEVLAEPGYEIVSSDFVDANTAAMVRLGQADTLNVFFVEDFSDSESLGGISGGIPGGLGFQNGHNGVLLNAAGFVVDGSLLEARLAETTFHEIGHLVGLYHTTEAQFTGNDVLADTPACRADVHDINQDGIAASTECPDSQNPMFWQNSVLTEWDPLTDDQKWVIYHSPLAVPGD